MWPLAWPLLWSRHLVGVDLIALVLSFYPLANVTSSFIHPVFPVSPPPSSFLMLTLYHPFRDTRANLAIRFCSSVTPEWMERYVWQEWGNLEGWELEINLNLSIRGFKEDFIRWVELSKYSKENILNSWNCNFGQQRNKSHWETDSRLIQSLVKAKKLRTGLVAENDPGEKNQNLYHAGSVQQME